MSPNRRRETRWRFRIACIRNRAGQLVPAGRGLGCRYLHATPPASRQCKSLARSPRAAFHTTPARLPCGRCTPRPASPRTTFFSRHGFRSWLSSSPRMVSRPTRGTSLRLIASSVSSRMIQRARPSGGEQATAMMRCVPGPAPEPCPDERHRTTHDPGRPAGSAWRSATPPWPKARS